MQNISKQKSKKAKIHGKKFIHKITSGYKKALAIW